MSHIPVRHTKIEGITSDNIRHIFLCDVCKSDGYYTSNTSGVVLKVTARGMQIVGDRSARSRAYRTLRGIQIENKMYRTDIGKRAVSYFNDFILSGLLYEH
jgi:phosphoribosylamine-glycine ligase